jgi:hypothetical protein
MLVSLLKSKDSCTAVIKEFLKTIMPSTNVHPTVLLIAQESLKAVTLESNVDLTGNSESHSVPKPQSRGAT